MTTTFATGSNLMSAVLLELGWRRLHWTGELFQHGDGPDAARLEFLAPLSDGARWRIDAPSIVPPPAHALLAAQAALQAPVKFAGHGHDCVCVADLPASVVAASDDFDFLAGQPSRHPVFFWVECLTGLVTGRSPVSPSLVDAAVIVPFLQQAGYVVSRDGAGCKLTVPLPGRCCEMAIDPDQRGGLRLSVSLGGAPAPGTDLADAVSLLAAEANHRLLLARLSESAETGALQAEVCLPLTRVSDVWLLAAVESLIAGVELVAMPLARLLHDPALAAHVSGP